MMLITLCFASTRYTHIYMCIQRSSFFTIFSLPLFNAVATIIFIAITILAFSMAYGMPVEAHIAGMSYPSFIGLMMALILLLLGDGIG